MPEPLATNKGGLWARLFAMAPEKDGPANAAVDAPASVPVGEPSGDASALSQAEEAMPFAWEQAPEPTPEPTPEEAATAFAFDPGPDAVAESLPDHAEELPAPATETVPAAQEATIPQPCAACGAARRAGQPFCDDCGYFFPEAEPM